MNTADKFDLIVPLLENSMWDAIENDETVVPSADIKDWTSCYDEVDDKFFYIDENAPHYTIENDENVDDLWGWIAHIWYEDENDTWHSTMAAHKCFEAKEALAELIKNYF